MKIFLRPQGDDADRLQGHVVHDDGTSTVLDVPVSYIIERLTPQQLERLFFWSWFSLLSTREEFRQRFVSASTSDDAERGWTLTLRFPGVPNPGWMLPDGSTHT